MSTSQLLHEESHAFLTGIGFYPRPTIAQTSKIAYDYPGAVSIVLNRSVKVTSYEKLFKIIVEQSYEDGREQGKNDAVSSIMKSFTRIIFDIK